jgi:hypothetical protein
VARENGWGFTRILDELNELDLGKFCQSSVTNILKEASL